MEDKKEGTEIKKTRTAKRNIEKVDDTPKKVVKKVLKRK